MPTERFYRLPEEKQQTIRMAAFKEFSRVPFEKVSINRIIQNADISRGSFYTYFLDKQDVVEFLMRENFEQLTKLCKDELDSNGGDFFAMVELMFEYFMGKMKTTKELMDFAKNVFANQENAQLLGFRKWPCLGPTGKIEEEDPVKWMYEKVDKSRFYFATEEEFWTLVTMAMGSLVFSLKQFYEYPDRPDNIRRTFRRTMEILKHGVYKKQTEPEKSRGDMGQAPNKTGA